MAGLVSDPRQAGFRTQDRWLGWSVTGQDRLIHDQRQVKGEFTTGDRCVQGRGQLTGLFPDPRQVSIPFP